MARLGLGGVVPNKIVSGRQHAFLNKAELAEQYLKKAISYNPNDPETWEYYGHAVGMQARHAEAIAAFRKSLELGPGNATVLFALGCAYGAAKDKHNVKEVYRQLQSLSPLEAKEFADPVTGCLKQ